MSIPVDTFKMRVMGKDMWKLIAPALEKLGYVWNDGTPLSKFYPRRNVYGFIFRIDKSVVHCSFESTYDRHDCPEIDCNHILRNQHCAVYASEFE